MDDQIPAPVSCTPCPLVLWPQGGKRRKLVGEAKEQKDKVFKKQHRLVGQYVVCKMLSHQSHFDFYKNSMI